MDGSIMKEQTVTKGCEVALGHFRQQRYKEALSAYNKVLAVIQSYSKQEISEIREKQGIPVNPVIGPSIHPKLGSIVDQRAATYEKLGLLEKALKDGERLIEFEPVGSKGYLRAGKVLLLLNKEMEAYKVYYKGVHDIREAIEEHKIVVSAKLFESLNSQYAALKQKLMQKKERIRQNNEFQSARVLYGEGRIGLIRSATDPATSKSKTLIQTKLPLKRAASTSSSSPISTKKPQLRVLDPLLIFPLEIIIEIFSKLPFSSVMISTIVSKHWFEIITSIPTFFQNIRFKTRIQFSDFCLGMKRLNKAHQKSAFRRIDHVRLRPKGTDERTILNYLFNRVSFDYQGLEFILSECNLYELVRTVTKDDPNGRNIANLKRLRLISKFVHGLEYKLLHMLPELESLELLPTEIIIPNRNVLDLSSFQIPEMKNKTYPNLKHLSLISNPKLERNHLIPFVELFQSCKFPNLGSLVIVGFDFTNFISTPTFSNMFNELDYLKNLTLEYNKGLTWEIFLTVFQFSSSRLDSLLLREDIIQSVNHLRQFQVENLPQLHGLKSLDIYGSSLSFEGLLKLLTCCSNSLERLYMGGCQYLVFKTGRLGSRNVIRGGMFDFNRFLSLTPKVTHLYLNENNIDNFTLKEFHSHLKNLKFETKLEVLDLSFCNIEGIGLVDLFNAGRKTERSFKLKRLVIDGIDISLGTLKLLKDWGFVEEIMNDTRRARWKEYGVNTLIPI